jgi:hypothetical protein
VRIRLPHGLREALDHRAEAFLALGQPGLRLLVLGDVDHEQHAARVRTLARDTRGREQAPPAAAVLARHLLGVRQRDAVVDEVAQGARRHVPEFGRRHVAPVRHRAQLGARVARHPLERGIDVADGAVDVEIQHADGADAEGGVDEGLVFAQRPLGRAALLDLALQVFLAFEDGPQALLDLAFDLDAVGPLAAAGLVGSRGEGRAGTQQAQVVGIEAGVAAVGQHDRQRAQRAAADPPGHAEEFGQRYAGGAQRRELLGRPLDQDRGVGLDDGAARTLAHRPLLAPVPVERAGHDAPAHLVRTVRRCFPRPVARMIEHGHDDGVGPAHGAHGVGQALHGVLGVVGQRLRQPGQRTGFLGPIVRGQVRRAFAQQGFHDFVVVDSDRCVRCRVGHGDRFVDLSIVGCLRPATLDYLTIRSLPIEFESCSPCLATFKELGGGDHRNCGEAAKWAYLAGRHPISRYKKDSDNSRSARLRGGRNQKKAALSARDRARRARAPARPGGRAFSGAGRSPRPARAGRHRAGRSP